MIRDGRGMVKGWQRNDKEIVRVGQRMVKELKGIVKEL